MDDQAGLPEEETRGGAKRKPEEAEAEEDRAVTARNAERSSQPGVKRKAEEEAGRGRGRVTRSQRRPQAQELNGKLRTREMETG